MRIHNAEQTIESLQNRRDPSSDDIKAIRHELLTLETVRQNYKMHRTAYENAVDAKAQKHRK